MTDLILKLIKKEKITDKDLSDALYEICDEVHASCNNACPICDLLDTPNFFCPCFKNGRKMLRFLRKHFGVNSK